MLTQEFLHSIFEYRDGDLYWKVDRTANKMKGKKAGCLDGRGYLQTKVNNILYKNHRLIYIMHYGHCPALLDHKDGNPLNNHVYNLREATLSQNAINAKKFSTNKSGVKNVSWHKGTNKWVVKININKNTIHFGGYDDLELADLVAMEARDKYCQQFARHK